MVYRKALVALMIATLAGCSAAEEENISSSPDRDVFERRNTAPDPADNTLEPRRAEQAYARIALNCINKQYPNKISHVLNSAADVAEPAKLTPIFYGCFDWHSAVHGHWLLTRLWGQDLVPEMDEEIAAALKANFTAEKVAGELAYFQGADRTAFERPYGIAWFLQLTAELRDIANGTGGKAEQAKLWLARLQPLETLIVGNIKDWLPKLAYPVRLGTHNQSAFAFGLFLDWAARSGDRELAALVREKSLSFHRQDRDCPMAYEPSGEDFLSSCLMVADLMRRVMDGDEYARWLSAFLPNIPEDGSGDWLAVGIVNDPTDGKLVHLDGLNLSRAWALEGMASALPAGDARRASLLASARLHGDSGEQAVRTPHYSGSHWLASFATYWRTRRGIDATGSNPDS
ncbi:DUF2891 domain-containing protein [Sphingorhabdus sp. SMR4y]|uniref:DUF2891 domain-containing protein n=1 Tax=Sphingorhabdus sp. SMR4y TaxID=2584094 RepID=UPI000B6143A9|nr:DUF2891 domain-containing protein [Sphingorhabdus sp. SMR4y]ASK89743.1 hypothetical protein SPHFLASMR4Y_03010 [Sphingorhabdus sp. SMR4y]